MPEHETFYVVSADDPQRRRRTVTVLHEIPVGAQKLGSFADPVQAIDFAQEEVRSLKADGVPAEFVDPPDDLIGAG